MSIKTTNFQCALNIWSQLCDDSIAHKSQNLNFKLLPIVALFLKERDNNFTSFKNYNLICIIRTINLRHWRCKKTHTLYWKTLCVLEPVHLFCVTYFQRSSNQGSRIEKFHPKPHPAFNSPLKFKFNTEAVLPYFQWGIIVQRPKCIVYWFFHVIFHKANIIYMINKMVCWCQIIVFQKLQSFSPFQAQNHRTIIILSSNVWQHWIEVNSH